MGSAQLSNAQHTNTEWKYSAESSVGQSATDQTKGLSMLSKGFRALTRVLLTLSSVSSLPSGRHRRSKARSSNTGLTNDSLPSLQRADATSMPVLYCPSWSTALDARAAQPAHKLAQSLSVGLLQYPQAVRESTNRRNNSNHLQTPGHLPAVVAPLAAEAFYRSRHTVSSY